MAVNLLNDELKSDICCMVPPITKEKIVKEVNALIYHFKIFGICYEKDINYPSGSDYLASISPESIVNDDHGIKMKEQIERLKYLVIPIELEDIIIQINLIIEIIKSGTSSNFITSSAFFEHLKYDIYKNTPDLEGRCSELKDIYSEKTELQNRINNLQFLELPLTYLELIKKINEIINLFKTEIRIVDANDFILLVSSLKEEVSIDEEGTIDYGNSATNGDKDDYGKATTINKEFQAND